MGVSDTELNVTSCYTYSMRGIYEKHDFKNGVLVIECNLNFIIDDTSLATREYEIKLSSINSVAFIED